MSDRMLHVIDLGLQLDELHHLVDFVRALSQDRAGRRLLFLDSAASGIRVFERIRELIPDLGAQYFSDPAIHHELIRSDRFSAVVVVAQPEFLIRTARFVSLQVDGDVPVVLPFSRLRSRDIRLDPPNPIVLHTSPNCGTGRVRPVLTRLLVERLQRQYLPVRMSWDHNLRLLPRFTHRRQLETLSFGSSDISVDAIHSYYEQVLVTLPNDAITEIHDHAAPRLYLSHPDIRVIYLMRDPRDVLVSLYYWLIGPSTGAIFDPLRQMERTKGMEALSRGLEATSPRTGYVYKVPSVADMAQTFLEAARQPGIFALRYEDVRLSPLPTYRALLSWLEADRCELVNFDDEALEDAIRLGSFELQSQGKIVEGRVSTEFLTRNDNQLGALALRKGIVGDWKTELDPALAQRILADSGEALAALGYAEQ